MPILSRRTSRAPRGLILFVEWDCNRSARVRKELDAFMARCAAVEWTLVRIDNADPDLAWSEVGSAAGRAYRVGGDNSSGEFSGWDKGYAQARERLGDDADVVVIVNDALLNSKPVEQIAAIDNEVLEYLVRWDGVAGWLDNYCDVSPEPLDILATPMMLFGHTSRWWFCTTFLVVSAGVWRRVSPLAQAPDEEVLYFEAYDGRAFRADCGLNEMYQRFLLMHQSQVWRTRYALTAATYPLFKSKTRMILNEHLLGCRLAETGATPIDLKAVYRMSDRQRRRARLLRRAAYVRFRYLGYISQKANRIRMEKGRETRGGTPRSADVSSENLK